jgi:hypothetical protein
MENKKETDELKDLLNRILLGKLNEKHIPRVLIDAYNSGMLDDKSAKETLYEALREKYSLNTQNIQKIIKRAYSTNDTEDFGTFFMVLSDYLGIDNASELTALLNYYVGEGLYDRQIAGEVYDIVAPIIDPIEAYDFTEEEKSYLLGYESSDDLVNRAATLGLDEVIATNLWNKEIGGKTDYQLTKEQIKHSLQKAQQRNELSVELNKPQSYSDIKSLLDTAVNQGIIDYKEALDYIDSYQNSMGEYQQSLAPALSEIYNNPYLTQEDFAPYLKDEGVRKNDAEALNMMVRELQSTANKRQMREQEEQTINAMIGYQTRPLNIQKTYIDAPDASKILQDIAGKSNYASGSRLQSLLESGLNRIGQETAEERSEYFSQERPLSYDEVASELQYRIKNLQNIADRSGMESKLSNEQIASMASQYGSGIGNLTPTKQAVEATSQADKYQAQLSNLDKSQFVDPNEWTRNFLANDPLLKKASKYDLATEYRKLTQSQRGQNVSRFVPSLRF